jgi:hypothetical protein
VGKRRRDHNRLGVAMQLATVRFLGTFLADPADMPPGAVRHVAEELAAGGLVADVGEAVRRLKLYRDAEVRWDHQAEIRVRYGYRDFGDAGVQLGLLRWLYARAWVAAERPSVLFDLAAARLVEAKVLLPGARCSPGWWLVCARGDAAVVPPGPDARRRPPTALTARALAGAVERIRDLRALDVDGLDLLGCPRRASPPWPATPPPPAPATCPSSRPSAGPPRSSPSPTWARRGRPTMRSTCSTSCCGA